MIDQREDWARCRDWIAASAAVSPLPEPMDVIEKKLADGIYQFWPGESSAAITEIMLFRDTKAMCVRYGGGSLSELLTKVEPALCEVAKAMGCTKMMSEGREGWKRAAEKSAYKFAWLTMIKDI